MLLLTLTENSWSSGDFRILRSKGAVVSLVWVSFGLLLDFKISGGAGTEGQFKACVIGCNVPLGSKKQGASGLGRFVPGSLGGRTLALQNSEYGTMIMGLVGKARNGCWAGREVLGDGGVRQVVVSTGDAGVEPEVQLEVVLELAGRLGVVLEGFTTCLELQ